MNDETTLDALCTRFLQVVNQYQQLEKQSRQLLSTDLHLSETHTIIAIGDNDQINVTTLAELQRVSRSAASQMVTRLVQKGYVIKQTSPKTDNEVVLSLTSKGVQVFQQHKRQHLRLQEQLSAVLARYPQGIIEVMYAVAGDVLALWDDPAWLND